MYKQGEILLIPIPFSDLVSKKKRPVLVISNSQYNYKTEDVIVVAITSNLEQKEYTIIITNHDLVEGNLKVDSCIRVDKIYTLSQDIVLKRFGSVKRDIIDQVKDKINKLINE